MIHFYKFVTLTCILLFATCDIFAQTITVTVGQDKDNAHGNYSVIVPSGSTNVNGTLWGAGGGGGGATACGYSGGTNRYGEAAASGGGGGGYNSFIWGNTTGTYSITVGQGGVDTSNHKSREDCYTTNGQSCYLIWFCHRYGDGCATAESGGNSVVSATGQSITVNGGFGGKSCAADAQHANSNQERYATGVGQGGEGGQGGQDGSPGTVGNNSDAGVGGTGGAAGLVVSGNPGQGGNGAAVQSPANANCVDANGGRGADGKVVVNFSLTPDLTAPTISGDITACKGTNITLTATPKAITDASATSYTWYKNGTVVAGATSSTLVVTINNTTDYWTCKATNTYTIRTSGTVSQVTIAALSPFGTDGNTNIYYTTDESTQWKCTNMKDKPTVSITTPATICLGQEFNITPTTTNNGSAITAYSWMLGASQISTLASLSYSPVSGDNGKSLTLTVTNACGNTTSNAVLITVNALPDITSNSIDVCSGVPFSFTAASFGTDISTLSWAAPTFSSCSGTPSAAAEQSSFAGTLTSILSNDGATAVYSVTAKSAAGCTFTETVTLIVICVPEIHANVSAPAICSGGSLSFKPTDGTDGILTSSTEYKWTVVSNANITLTTTENTWAGTTGGIGNPITATNIVNLTTTPQTQQFTVTYRRNSNCIETEKTFTLSFVVNPNPDFTVSNPATVCAPTTVDISTSVSGLTPSSSILKYYEFNVGGGILGGELSSINVNTSGTYWIQATSTEGCLSDPKSVTVTINPLPVISGNTAVCVGSALPLSTSLAGGSWSISPTSVATIDASGIVSGITAGNATVTYTLNGCSNTYNITVNALPEITATTNATECAVGSVNNITISATASAGDVVRWYATAVSTDLLYSGNTWTINTLTAGQSITYYVQAFNSTTNCMSSLPRTAVTATLQERQTIPEERWGGYNGVCPIDESNSSESPDEIYAWIDTLTNITYVETVVNTQPSGCSDCVPDTSNHTNNYFANYVEWDYLPTNGILEENVDFYTDISLFYNINWYNKVGSDYILIKSGGVLTDAGEALQTAGKFLPFWQNEPYTSETYYASIAADATKCESAMKEITVYITDAEVNLDDICYSTYTRQSTSSMLQTISWEDVFKKHYGFNSVEQGLYWFDDQATAEAGYLAYTGGGTVTGNVTPTNISLTAPVNTTSKWVFRYESLAAGGCATAPLKVTVSVYEHPYTETIVKRNGLTKDTLCVGESTTLVMGLRPIPASGDTKYYYLIAENGDAYTIKSDTLQLIDGITNACLVSNSNFNLGVNTLEVYRLWDDNAGSNVGDVWTNSPCFDMDDDNDGMDYDDFAQAQNIEIRMEDKPIVGNITAPTVVCAGNTLSLSIPEINNNYGAITVEEWKIESTDGVWTTFNPSTDMDYANHNGKKLRYYATNKCGIDSSNAVTISVKDRPLFTEQLTPWWTWSVCEGTSFEIDLMVTHFIGTDYQGGTAQPSQWILSTTANENHNALSYIPLTQPYTALFEDNGKWIALAAINECGTDTVFAQLVVIQNPVLNPLLTAVCSGTEITLTPQNGVNGDFVPVGTTFAWDRAPIPPNISGSTNTYHTGGSTIEWQTNFVQTLTNSSNAATNMVYYLYANNNGCMTTPVNYTVTVNPKPALANKTYPICSDVNFTMIQDINDVVPTGTTYTWTVASNANVTGQSDVASPTTTMSQTLINTTNDTETVTYTVTPTAGSCIGSPFTVTVNVYPQPKVEISFDPTICEGSNCTLLFTGNPTFTLTYTVNSNPPATYGLGTTFSSTGSDYILQPASSPGQTYTVNIAAGAPGTFNFVLTKIVDGHGCIIEN